MDDEISTTKGFSKEWCLKMAELEGDQSVSAGLLAGDPWVGHGSPELDADAEKLEAMGADPGPTWEGLISDLLPCDTYECADRLWCIQRAMCKKDQS